MSDPADPSHADSIEVSRLASPLQLLLLIAAAALAVVAVAMPIRQLTQDQAVATVNLSESATHQAVATVALANGHVTSTGDEGLTVNLVVDRLQPGDQPIPLYLRLLTTLGTAVWALGLAIIAYLLARVLGNLAAGDPFHESHARRFSLMALCILLISVGADTVNYVNATLLTSAIGTAGEIDVTAYYSPIPIALAAVTLVLAGAFRSGRRIQQDTEGLV